MQVVVMISDIYDVKYIDVVKMRFALQTVDQLAVLGVLLESYDIWRNFTKRINENTVAFTKL